MKHFLRDAAQITVALLLTILVATAMHPPATQSVAQGHVLAIKTVKVTTPTKEPLKTSLNASVPVPSQPIAVPVIPTTPDEIMAAAGIDPVDYGAVDYIVSHESHWCATVWEGEVADPCPAFHGVSSTDGYGLCQSTPPQKMSAAGTDWQTNPVTQLKWCTSHAAEYGGWWSAYNHWRIHHNW